MKWRGIVRSGDAAPWKPLPMSLDRAAMAVLSQQVCTTMAMPACIRAALVATEIGSSSNGASSNGAYRAACRPLSRQMFRVT